MRRCNKLIKELCTKLLDSKMAENENFIRFTFYELRVKNNLSDKDTDEFLRLCMTYLENKGYEASNKENGISESLKVALEMSARNIKISNFDLYKSRGTIFMVEDDNTIIPPFISIDGLGEVVAKNIEKEAKKGEFISIEDFQARCKVSQTLIDKMRAMGIFSGMPETSQLTLF